MIYKLTLELLREWHTSPIKYAREFGVDYRNHAFHYETTQLQLGDYIIVEPISGNVCEVVKWSGSALQRGIDQQNKHIAYLQSKIDALQSEVVKLKAKIHRYESWADTMMAERGS